VDCRCGCGEQLPAGRSFVDKRHQLRWLGKGGAREIGALAPAEARRRGGRAGGRSAVASGRLLAAARRGGERTREIAEEMRQEPERRPTWGPFRRRDASAGDTGREGGTE
jgi:hypothetical protein